MVTENGREAGGAFQMPTNVEKDFRRRRMRIVKIKCSFLSNWTLANHESYLTRFEVCIPGVL